MSRNAWALVVLVACLGASWWLLTGRDGAARRHRRDLADELAAWVVREAAAGGTGALLILAPPPAADDPFPGHLGDRLHARARAAGFGPITLKHVSFQPALESTGEPITRDTFLGLLRAHADAEVVISLVGVPRLVAADRPAAGRPRLIVASTVLMPYLKELPAGLLDFAIEVRRDQVPETADPALGELGNYFILTRPR